jgi:hypothetical protein
MGVWQGVAMDSLKYHEVLPCLTLLCAGQVACGLLPPWTPHTVRL